MYFETQISKFLYPLFPQLSSLLFSITAFYYASPQLRRWLCGGGRTHSRKDKKALRKSDPTIIQHFVKRAQDCFQVSGAPWKTQTRICSDVHFRNYTRWSANIETRFDVKFSSSSFKRFLILKTKLLKQPLKAHFFSNWHGFALITTTRLRFNEIRAGK